MQPDTSAYDHTRPSCFNHEADADKSWNLPCMINFAASIREAKRSQRQNFHSTAVLTLIVEEGIVTTIFPGHLVYPIAMLKVIRKTNAGWGDRSQISVLVS